MEWPKCPATDEQIKKMRQEHAKEYHSDFRERNSAKLDNRSEAWGHYAQWISQSEKTLVPLIWGMWNEKVKLLWYQRVERWLRETGNRGEREVTDGQAGSFSQVKWTNSRVCCTTLNQQSTVMDYNHLMSLTGYVRYSNTSELVYETQNHRHREQICGYQGSGGGAN